MPSTSIAEQALLEASELTAELRLAAGFLREAGLSTTARALTQRANQASQLLRILRSKLGAQEPAL